MINLHPIIRQKNKKSDLHTDGMQAALYRYSILKIASTNALALNENEEVKITPPVN